MPYFEEGKYLIPPNKKRTRKLSDEDREDIKKMYASGDFSYNTLAKKFNVSKRLIIFIVNPESKRREYERRRERIRLGLYQQYNPEKGAEYMRNHRRYKRELFKQGALVKKPDVT